ncbi:MAG: hypothetical protein U0174_28345 [Polyangiaceae bacterium]
MTTPRTLSLLGLFGLCAVGLAAACGGDSPNGTPDPEDSGTTIDSGSSGSTDGGTAKDSGTDSGVATFSVSGTVENLAGSGLELQVSNGGQTVVVNKPASSGDAGPPATPFAFTTKLATGTAYAVTVKTQPSNATQTCSVVNGTGTIGNANVTNVKVVCATNAYSIKGTITGLGVGASVTIENNGGDSTVINSSSPGFPNFAFAQKVASGAAYDVKVKVQPTNPNQICTVTKGSGPVTNADITDVAINCKDAYLVGGTISNLGAGKTLVLQNNAGDDITITEATAGYPNFSFPTRIVTGGAYKVTVKTQPANRDCTVTNDMGNVAAADVTNVKVSCTCVSGKVLLLGCGNAETDLFETAFTDVGLTVTKVASATTYQNVPAANTFNAVMVLDGDQWPTDMSAAGQTGIVAANNAGVGVVLTEWAQYHVNAEGQWTTLAPLTMKQATSPIQGPASSTVAAGMENHPLWRGLPANFTVPGNFGYDNGPAKANVLTIATGTGALYARDAAGNVGRQVHAPFAVGWNGTSISQDTNAKRLFQNSAIWAAKCD